MIIRKTRPEEVDILLDIINTARTYMINNGNKAQWQNGYPGRNDIETDIKNENSYVCVDGDEIIATFALVPGEEPTYRIIDNGSWSSEKPYGTIHRVASKGTRKGIAKACFDFCISCMEYVRIDTHRSNISMREAVRKYGFRECGIVYMSDGSERIAFDFGGVNE